MVMVTKLWRAFRVAFAEEFWGDLVKRAPPPEPTLTHDSPTMLSAQLDAIERRLEQRRVKASDLKAARR